MAEADTSGLHDHLHALRNANDGWAISVWKDGSWKLWGALDAKYAERDPNWLSTLSDQDVNAELGQLAATGHRMCAAHPPPEPGEAP